MIEEPPTWRFQSHVPENTALWTGFIIPLTRKINQKCQGKLIVQSAPADHGTVDPHHIASLVSKGTLESGETSMLDTKQIPEAAVATTLPFSFDNSQQIIDFWYYYRDGKAINILEGAYESQGIKLVTLVPMVGTYGFMTTFPVTRLNDFSGKTIRSIGVYAQILNQLGAKTIRVSLGDTLGALERGEIQGVAMGFGGLEEYNWKSALKYIIMPPIVPCSPVTFIVNLKKWRMLPEELKQTITRSAKETVEISLRYYSNRIEAIAMDEAVNKYDVQIVNLPQEEIKKLRHMALPVWERITNLSANNRLLVGMLKEYLDEKMMGYPGK